MVLSYVDLRNRGAPRYLDASLDDRVGGRGGEYINALEWNPKFGQLGLGDTTELAA